MHSVFYIENKDDISEDLLNDFKEDTKQPSKSKVPLPTKLRDTPQALGPSSIVEAAPQNVIVMPDRLMS